jgi:streptomycin 3"-adenylyltransferase
LAQIDELLRLPELHRPVLARARRIYLGQEPEGWEDLRPAIQPCAAAMLEAIQGARAAG